MGLGGSQPCGVGAGQGGSGRLGTELSAAPVLSRGHGPRPPPGTGGPAAPSTPRQDTEPPQHPLPWVRGGGRGPHRMGSGSLGGLGVCK